MADLLPCPFCGGRASMDQDEGRRGTSRQSCIVVCTYCGCKLESNEEGDRCGNDWNRRAQLAPPELMPEDVEALATKMAAMINTSIWPVEKWNSLARLVLADRQRAVEAEREACAMEAHKKLLEWHKHDRALREYTDKGGAFLWNDVREIIRARGAAREG